MSEILTSASDGIATITINRLEKKNSITGAMYAALAEAVTAAADDASVRVLVLQGGESVFSAGNDLKDFIENPFADTDAPVVRFLFALSTFPKPIVAAVCGPAVGIGTTMLLHCELVIAGDNAVFSLPFANLGLCPEAASSYLLPQLLGYRRAAEALLLGSRIAADEAQAMGFVNAVVPAAEAADLAQKRARQLAAQPLTSLIETKRLLKGGQSELVRERMLEEFELFVQLLQRPAAKEAFAAFYEGRSPDFRSVGE